MSKNYLIGTEPNQNHVQSPQEYTEQTNSGVSGTTHGTNKVTPEDAHSRIKALQETLRN